MVISAQRFLPVSVGGKNRQLTYKSNLDVSGYAALPHDLTINGVTKSPTFRYEGGSATPTLWTATVGSDLAIAGSGDAPVIDEYAPGLTDSRVDFQGAKYYQAASASYAQPGTDDLVIEVIYRQPAATEYIFNKYVNAGNRIVFLSLTGEGRLTLNGISATVTVTNSTWNHAIFFIDRSGSMVGYLNGSAGGSAVISSLSAVNFGSTAKWTIGASSSGTSNATDSIAYCAVWQGASWLDTHLQTTVAKERFHKACGVYPQLAKGTAAPSVATRSTVAYIDKLDSSGNRLLVPVGAEWMRVCEREDSNGDTLAGYLPETQSQNKCLQSEDIETTWTKTQAADSFDANSVVAPDGTLTADGMIAANAALPHGVRQDITVTAAQWVFSTWAKKGDLDWLCLHDDDVANADAWFDLDNGVVGTKSAGCTSSGIEAWGNGWYRCWIEVLGTAAAHTFVVHSAEADEDETFNGDGSTVNTSIWGMQCELGSIPSSYIKTTSAAVTRTKDQLQAVAGANIGGEDVGKGAMECSVLIPNYNNAAVLSVLSLSDGGSAADSIVMSVNTSDLCAVDSAASGGNAGASTALGDVSTNVITVLKAKYNTNSLTATKDNVADTTPDTECDMPDDVDEIDIGQSIASATQPGGLIGKIKIYKKPV